MELPSGYNVSDMPLSKNIWIKQYITKREYKEWFRCASSIVELRVKRKWKKRNILSIWNDSTNEDYIPTKDNLILHGSTLENSVIL